MTILLVALVATAAIGLWGWRVITRAQTFIARLDDLAAAASDMDVRRWPEVCPRLALTAAAAADLRQAGGPALPLAARLAPRPYAGDLAASGPLLDAAVSLGAAGEAACAALTVLSAPPEPGLSAPEAAVSRLAAARPSLAAARAEVDRANALLGQIDAAALSPSAGARVSMSARCCPSPATESTWPWPCRGCSAPTAGVSTSSSRRTPTSCARPEGLSARPAC